ncbi:MAG: hypothetical protein ACRDY7_02775, partial [Acidimicrobiia bacterium]
LRVSQTHFRDWKPVRSPIARPGGSPGAVPVPDGLMAPTECHVRAGELASKAAVDAVAKQIQRVGPDLA